ncbi:MAG: hypothetical protein M3P83_07950 [Actinomycetota bacterium]|nr:hypothetical protein [Actinomycetota bacterium]
MTEQPDADNVLNDLSTPDPMPDTEPDNAAEDLDEDRLAVDPLDEGMDPPERYSGADRFGTTPWEQAHGQDLEHRLREEQPDITDPDLEGPSGAGAAAPAGGGSEPDEGRSQAADEQLEEIIDDSGSRHQVEPDPDDYAVEVGRSADEAGGSVADTMRTPENQHPEDTDE